ncbi:MAG: PDZ domain-containing protein [Pyrinomonadaceae bacterium]|nr:PDZ domain-containing protein [Pyrinomonadaceae bacterium]
MTIESRHSDAQTNSAGAVTATVCPNCRTAMPSELRFCRQCGFRLGEGVAEFTETVRFEKKETSAAQPKGQATSAPKAATNATPKWNSCASVNEWGALAMDMSQKAIQKATKHFEEQRQKHEQRQEQKQQKAEPRKESPRRPSFMVWLIAIIVISIIISGGLGRLSGLRQLRDSLRGLSSSNAGASRSWVGTATFKTSAGGVTFDRVEPAGSPADKAGLVGGDVITSFDGQTVKSGDELRKLLTATPIGKTVDVVYLRDGETRTTKLTTVSEDEIERLQDAADDGVRGYVGIGSSGERVQIPGTNISGVRLDSIRRNNPAYIAGMRDGDIVIEFDGVPTRTYAELESRTRRAAPDSTVKAVVMRGSERIELVIKVGIDD